MIWKQEKNLNHCLFANKIKVCTYRAQKKKEKFWHQNVYHQLYHPRMAIFVFPFEILLGLSKHCNTYAKALCLYTCTPNTKETASRDIKEKTTYNQCLCILDGRYIYLKSFPWFVWPKTCLSCILNDILWLPNNLFSLIIILNPSHTVGFIKFVSML